MTDNLFLYELQKIRETISKTREQRTLNIRIKKNQQKSLILASLYLIHQNWG